MKFFKVLLRLIIVAATLFATTFSVSAIDFNAEETYNSVVVVYSGNSLGSGFAIGENCIVTNAHVISDSEDVVVQTYEGEKCTAVVLGMDEKLDIAVLITSDLQFDYLVVEDEKTVKVGDDIYAIGAPKSMSYTLTKGVISAKERKIGDYTYIQIDAAINSGNSGGPLLNEKGHVIGVNTMKITDSEGIGLSIPISRVCAYLKDLKIEIDDAGNVKDELKVPDKGKETPDKDMPDKDMPDKETQDKDTQDKEPSDKPTKIPDKKDEVSAITIVALVIAGISLIGNVVLLSMLLLEKRKNLTMQYDPRERTDFEIDILE